jgi:hypothetical protein
MRSGVLKDIERKKLKAENNNTSKSDNLEMIKAQIELEKKLSKKEQ